MPFDESLKPDTDAELMAGFPVEGGWNFIPVTDIFDGKAVLYTDNFGDPVIGWRFSQLERNPHPTMDPRTLLNYSSCRSGVLVSVEPIEVMGSTYYKVMAQYYDPNGDVSKARIKLEYNYFITGIHDNVFEAWTDENGYYEIVLDTDSYSAIGEQAQDYYASKGMDTTQWRNSVKVTPLECRSIAGNPEIPIDYYGVSIFDWNGTISTPPLASAANVPNNQPASTPQPASIVTQETIPLGAIQLPNFVGKPFDEAVAWLKQNGFKHMWVDGKSIYDVGMVYAQQPAAGKYKVPHRTTVVLYRTTEKVIDPCFGLNLTPEECINLGTHEYHVTTVVSIASGADPNKHCRKPWDEYGTIQVTFSDGTAVFDGFWWMLINGKPFTKSGTNTFVSEADPPWIFKLVFTSTGFTIEEMGKVQPNNCVWNHTFTITP